MMPVTKPEAGIALTKNGKVNRKYELLSDFLSFFWRLCVYIHFYHFIIILNFTGNVLQMLFLHIPNT